MHNCVDVPALNMMMASLEKAPISAAVADYSQSDLSLTYVNQAFLGMTGYTKEETIGRNCRFLQGEDTDQQTVEKIGSALGQGQPISIDILNYRKDGTPFWNALEMAPLKNPDGKIIAIYSFQMDMARHGEHMSAEVARQKKRTKLLEHMTRAMVDNIDRYLEPVTSLSDSLKDKPVELNQFMGHLDMILENANSAREFAIYLGEFILYAAELQEKEESRQLVSGEEGASNVIPFSRGSRVRN